METLWLTFAFLFCLSQAVICIAEPELETEPATQTEAAVTLPDTTESEEGVSTTEATYFTTLMTSLQMEGTEAYEPTSTTNLASIEKQPVFTNSLTTATHIQTVPPVPTGVPTRRAGSATAETLTTKSNSLTTPNFLEVQLLNRHQDQLRRESPEPEFHMCTTYLTCPDPNAHCVNLDQRNVCVCRLNFAFSGTTGVCEREVTPLTPTQHSMGHPTMDRMDNEADHSLLPSPPQTEVPQAREYAISAASLTPAELRGVVTLTFHALTDAVQWIVEADSRFRQTIADVIKTTNFTLTGEDGLLTTIALHIVPNDIIYIAPTPRSTPDGLVVSFIIQDRAGISQVKHNDHQHPSNAHAINVRRKRNSPGPSSSPLSIFPAQWIIPALQVARPLLNTLLGMNLTAIQSGLPSDLLAMESMVNMTLFERHLDIFVALIFLAAFCSLALALGLACIKVRARSSATWDPPAGYVYEKARRTFHSQHAESLEGQDLAPDAVCKEGEDPSNVDKHVIADPQDDDGWVVPYEEVMRTKLHTQVVDTRL